MSWNFEKVASCSGQAAGLLWDGSGILFCAIDESRVLRFDPASGQVTESRRYTNRTSALAAGPEGRLYAAQSGSRRVVQFNPDGTATPLASRLGGRIHNHPRDLSVDGQGRIWFTDPFSDIPAPGPQVHSRLDHASVLRLSKRANRAWYLERATHDTSFPTAVQVSADSSVLFLTENDPAPWGRREIRAYPIREDSRLGDPIVLQTFGADREGPHRGGWGLCLDPSGNLLVAAGGAAAGPGPMVYALSPTGRVLATHPLPEDPTDVCLGGDAVYVTTLSGGLFRARMG